MCSLFADCDDFYYYSRRDYGISTSAKKEIARAVGQYSEKVGGSPSSTVGSSNVVDNDSQRTTVISFATKKSGLPTSNRRT